jgi:hypothetical protein
LYAGRKRENMSNLYKLTDSCGKARNDTQWGPGISHSGTGEGGLCGPGWIHAYEHPLIAVLMNPIHANFPNPRLWEAEGEVGLRDGHLKCGCATLTTVREIPLPSITTEMRVRFAILCAKEVCACLSWNAWADRWLSGGDRTQAAAEAAAARAEASATRAYERAYERAEAAWAARAAAEAAASAWAAAAWAARAAAEAAAAEAAAAAYRASWEAEAAEAAAWSAAWAEAACCDMDFAAIAEKACAV